MSFTPDFNHILEARTRIVGMAVRTPLLRSAVLDDLCGGQVFLKPECLQRTGSFKFRGAFNAISANLDEALSKGVFAISSGNHSQGVAEACRLLGVKATILMPTDAPEIKLARTRRSGAEVVFYDRSSEDREVVSERWLAKSDALLIHPYENPFVIAGQGTMGVEIGEDLRALNLAADIGLVPTGGGGLAAGFSLAMIHQFPNATIHPVEPEGFDDYSRSLVAGEILSNPATSGSICDAILTPSAGKLSFAINQPILSSGIQVSDDEALYAVGFALQELKIVVEPGGAVCLAAILANKIDVAGKSVVVVLSGGNADPNIIEQAQKSYSIQA